MPTYSFYINYYVCAFKKKTKTFKLRYPIDSPKCVQPNVIIFWSKKCHDSLKEETLISLLYAASICHMDFQWKVCLFEKNIIIRIKDIQCKMK